ncbi:MAG TPA: methylmalonyl-CoA mutase family protein [Terriglobales bacterium]|nr:methylmalonyl-CoA mutase family protein [Terriglobales bacterium]
MSLKAPPAPSQPAANAAAAAAERHPSEREQAWQRDVLAPALEKSPERPAEFTTISGRPVQRLYTAADLPPDFDFERDVGFPGQPPYVRGIHPTMYRGRLWTMRQFSGFATPEQTNERYRYLLSQGQSGLSVAFDLPTLMGYDSDHAASEGEVGKCGVAIDSLEDMETLFRGIRLDQVTTSMTINSPAAPIWAMFLVAAERQGVAWRQLAGTLQNDILKEYIAQKEYIFPPGPSMRLVVDTIEFGARETPRFNPISISGYHIREAGSTALQELAFTLRDGMEYVEWALRRGLPVDAFAPRLSFFFNAHNDFFEEIAKYRAARKIWHRVMTERYGARDARSAMLRFHTQTAGVSLTAQQPYNNVARTAIQALAAVLGGTQSLHTNSLDEALALPTEHAATIALRTQQIIAHESGVANTVDPLGGSFFVEKLTLDMEQGAFAYFDRIDAMGGMVAAVEQGFPQREIADASYRYQQALEAKRKIMVGVNEFTAEEQPVPTLYIDESVREAQTAKLRALRARRDNGAVRRALDALKRAAAGDANVMGPLLESVRAYATLGEICDALREVFGTYEESALA